jgi:hypothetical protein
LYSSHKYNRNDSVKEDEIGRAYRTHEKKYAYRVLVGKPEGKRPQGRPKNWRVINIQMNLREIGWSGLDWLKIGIGGRLL